MKIQVFMLLFDDVYQIDEIVVAEPREIADYPYVRIYYKDEQGKMQSTRRMEFETQNVTQENGRRYYRIKLPSPIRTSEVRVGLGTLFTKFTIYNDCRDALLFL